MLLSTKSKVILLLFFIFTISAFLLSACAAEPFSDCGEGTIAVSEYKFLYVTNDYFIHQKSYYLSHFLITDMSFSNSGNLLALNDFAREGFYIFNITEEKMQNSIGFPVELSTGFQWSPDDSAIAFTNYHIDEYHQIFIYTIDNPVPSSQIDLGTIDGESMVAWLSDHEILAYDQKKERKPKDEWKNYYQDQYRYYLNLVTIDLETGQRTKIYTTNNSASTFESLSPDQNTVLYFSIPEAGYEYKTVFIYDLRDGRMNEIKNIPSEADNIIWSPNGNCLLYGYDGGLYVYSLKSKKITPIPFTYDPSERFGLAWGKPISSE
jgi:Tol biopolymer transport system component